MTEVTMLIDGDPMPLELSGKVTSLLHNDDMDIKSGDPNVVDITPEMTMARAAEVTDEMWEWFREEPSFVHFWAGLWRDAPLPEKLTTRAAKHTAGLIFLIIETLSEHKTPHLLYPETYLHPAQNQRMGLFLNRFFEYKREDQAHATG